MSPSDQSKAGVMNNKLELYVPYSDIGKTGVADNNKILAIHHPVNTNKAKSEFVVSSSSFNFIFVVSYPSFNWNFSWFFVLPFFDIFKYFLCCTSTAEFGQVLFISVNVYLLSRQCYNLLKCWNGIWHNFAGNFWHQIRCFIYKLSAIYLNISGSFALLSCKYLK